MSITTATVRAELKAAKTPTVFNKSAPLADTEVSQALSSSTKKFTIKVRGFAKLQLSFVSGESGTKFITVHPGAAYSEDLIDFSGTLFFQTDRASQTVEIIEWT